jgi:hypothetical protein
VLGDLQTMYSRSAEKPPSPGPQARLHCGKAFAQAAFASLQLNSLKTASAVAERHGQGIFVVINGVEWSLATLEVYDKPEDLALCQGYTLAGDLVVFNAEDVDLVRIPSDPDGGHRAALPQYRGG